MKTLKAILPMAILGLAVAVPASAQDDASSPPASESMHQAGPDMKSAGSDTWQAAKNAGEGTETAVRDTDVTAKVKMALHRDEATKESDIHVTTSAGIVTLTGNVRSAESATRAEQIAQATEGVKGVANELVIAGNTAAQ
jgi:hyperosmotically inducible protein